MLLAYSCILYIQPLVIALRRLDQDELQQSRAFWLRKSKWHFSRMNPSTLQLAQYHSSDCNDVAAMTPILDLCIAAALRRRGMFLSPTATLQDMLKRIPLDSWSGPCVTLAKRLLVHSMAYLSSSTLLYSHWISI